MVVFFCLFLGLFVPLFGSFGFRCFATLRLRQVLYVPPLCHSPIATFLSGVPAKSRPSLPQLIVLLFVFCFLWFPCILFPLYYFCFDFPLYFVFVGFSCICFSIFMYCFSLFVLCVFWFLQFCRSSPHLFRRTLSTARPFSTPPPCWASNVSFSIRGLLARDRFYFPVFLLFFACNKSCLNRPAFRCDAWSRSLGCGCEHYPSFWVKEDKCWLVVLSPQCQGISVCLWFSALSVKE